MIGRTFLAGVLTVVCFWGLALGAGCAPLPGDLGGDGGDGGDQGDGGSTAGVLELKAYTDSLGANPSAQQAPDDVDVNLTPTAYTVAFKRLVLKEVDEETEEVITEVEIFDADNLDEAVIIDLSNAMSSDVLDIRELPAGVYNKMDIEVFYLDMTVATTYPDTTSYDIPYRMVFEAMAPLEPRDFLLYLRPEWMEAGSELAASVTAAGWYWMEMSDPDHVEAVDGATEHPSFHVLDLFANDEFWASEHKVLEGGRINPPLEYDPDVGGVLTIEFDASGTFNFKDYHDEEIDPDGLWEIRQDAGIHPFPPALECIPEEAGELEDL